MLSQIFGDKYPLWQLVQVYWPIFPAALLAALVVTPLCRKVAAKLGIMDIPDQAVKTHKQPTAYLGGLGILAGVLAGLLIGFWILRHPPELLRYNEAPVRGFSGQYPNWLMLACIGVGAGIACMVGLIDDILDISPKQKILGVMLAALLLCAVDIRPNLTHLFSFVGITLPPALDLFGGWLLVFFIILGASNSLNLLDGLDGLCAGVTSIITLAYLLLALFLATWGYSPVGDPVRIILCLALVGGVMGFLPMNRHPAKIFMGDAGSMLLGYIAGALMLLFMEQMGRWSVASIVIFGLPILDTAVALVRRAINKKPLFVSDRGHIYDQLMDRGLKLMTTVEICYALILLYAIAGLIFAMMRFRWAVLGFVLLMALSALSVWRGGFLQIPRNQKSGVKSQEPE